MNSRFAKVEVDIKKESYLITVSVSNRTTGVGVSYVFEKTDDSGFDDMEIKRLVKSGYSAVGAN